MKKQLYLFLSAILMAASPLYAQNAEQLFFNQLAPDYDYAAASFVIDTPPNTSAAKRAFLLWSKNFTKDPSLRSLSLDEFDPVGNFLTEHVNPQPNVPSEYLVPKKIIKAQKVKGYYLLGYIIKSSRLINGISVYSTPLVIRLDDNLNPVWVARIHFAALTTNNAQTVIEYNDIAESPSSGDLILAGHYDDALGAVSRVLVTRLTPGAVLLWNFRYYNSTGCNANALSVTEAGDKTLALTGYVENCASTFSGPRQLLYLTLQSTGIPILYGRYTGAQVLSGDKIVRHATTSSGDQFFISGYTRIATPLDTQILVMDIRQDGGLIVAAHIGDAGQEVANDLIFKNVGPNAYYLYLTGATSSYYTNVKTEVYFMQLRYSTGSLFTLINNFSTFPSPSSEYVARRGLEIKKAGKDRFAILDNADYVVGGQQRTFTNVLIRDSLDGSGCIKLHLPPVKAFQPSLVRIPGDFVAPQFKLYAEDYKTLDKVSPRPQCGQFRIDPYNAFTIIGNADQITRQAQAISKRNEPVVKGLPALRVYPNPVRDQLYIDYGKVITGGNISARIYSTDMRLIREYNLPGGNRSSVPLNGLSSGLYFLQVQHKGATQVFEIKKE